MRLDGQSESKNVEDRRGQGGGRPPMLMGGGVTGLLLLALVVYLKGGGVGDFLKLAAKQQAAQPQIEHRRADPNAAPDPEEEELKKFVAIVLKDTEDVWGKLFAEGGARYQEPTLVYFSNYVQSACGGASSAVGPFYCPGDSKVYLDLQFYKELDRKFGAKGDFAQAYVVAHEVGHHVQHLLGITEKVDAMRGGPKANEYSVRLELQADYLAGVWAYHANKMRNMLEEGDVEEAMNCARQIGDDTLQKRAQGYVVPDSFTHGTSTQRTHWFTKGLKSGSMKGAEELFSIPYDAL